MKKIAMLIPYFGEFNNYFDLWLLSAAKNSAIDFFLFTPNVVQSPPENVHLVSMTFDDFQNLVHTQIGTYCKINEPYKLCDYRPTFGYLFSDYIQGFEYWGHCDLDVIFGNLEKYIYELTETDALRIFDYDHFMIYKNNHKVNYAFFECEQHRKIFELDYCCHFGENGIIRRKLEQKGLCVSGRPCYCADIWSRKFQFIAPGDPNLFFYDDGKLYGISNKNGELKQREYMYAHLQKRKMSREGEVGNTFYIIPNSFVASIENVYQMCNDVKNKKPNTLRYERREKLLNIRGKFQNVFLGALRYRLYQHCLRNAQKNTERNN